MSHTISQEHHSIWSWFLVHYCQKMIFPGVFFIFFFFIFIQKMVQNDKIFCPSRFISQKPYIISLSLWCKCVKWQYVMVICSGAFYNFRILIFWVVRGLKGQKMTQNDKIFCQPHLTFQEPYIIWSSFVAYMYV